MPAPVKPGNTSRYWREIEALGRLDIALDRDQGLTDDERRQVQEALVALKSRLTSVAKGRPAEG